MNVLSKLGIGIVGTSLSLGLANPAIAARLIYDFRVTDVTGGLAGQEFEGWFSFEDTGLTGVGHEFTGACFTCTGGPNAPGEFDGQLQFHFDFLGRTYTEQDEEFGRASVFFNDGVPDRIFYRNEQNAYSYKGSAYFFLFSALGGTDADGNPLGYRAFEYQFDGPLEWFGNGTVRIALRDDEIENPPQPVPEPTMILGLALFGLTGALKKNRFSLRKG